MGKLVLGFVLIFIGLFLSFVPPFIFGPMVIMTGLGLGSAGLASMGIGLGTFLTKTAIKAAKKTPGGSRSDQQSPSTTSLAGQPSTPIQPYDTARWNALIEYDPDLRRARDRLAVYGPKYTEKLAIDFLRLNDKSYLATMVADIETLARSDLASGRNPVGYDVAKWKYYADYDPDIQEAVKLLQTYGSGYVDMLARAFLASNNDKRLLGNMVAKIEAEARSNIEQNGERPTKSGKYLGYSWWEYADGVVVGAFADGDRTFSSMQNFMTAATTAARSTNG